MAHGDQPGHPDTETNTVHASCVVNRGRAVLITGPSGSGKSGLALQLIALGATLVADDRTQLRREGPAVLATVPERIRGLIEAREVGILHSPASDAPVPVTLVVDMSIIETDRLPPQRTTELLGLERPLLRKSTLPHFPAAILTYLAGNPAP